MNGIAKMEPRHVLPTRSHLVGSGTGQCALSANPVESPRPKHSSGVWYDRAWRCPTLSRCKGNASSTVTARHPYRHWAPCFPHRLCSGTLLHRVPRHRCGAGANPLPHCTTYHLLKMAGRSGSARGLRHPPHPLRPRRGTAVGSCPRVSSPSGTCPWALCRRQRSHRSDATSRPQSRTSSRMPGRP